MYLTKNIYPEYTMNFYKLFKKTQKDKQKTPRKLTFLKNGGKKLVYFYFIYQQKYFQKLDDFQINVGLVFHQVDRLTARAPDFWVSF